MTTDLVEKCARAVWVAKGGARDSDSAWAEIWRAPEVSFPYREAALAVIDALADGVSENPAMVQAFRAQWANSLSKHGETIDAVCARGLSAAIRAAKSQEG